MQHSPNLIPCPRHPDSLLNRVNPDPNSPDHAYCPECLLQMEDGITLYKKFQTIPTFLSTTAASFAHYKEKVLTNSRQEQPEQIYLDFLNGKAESLNKLSIHLSGQKEEVNQIYDEIKSVVIDTIERSRQMDLQKLDRELEKLNGFYENLERILCMVFPTQQQLDKMFPSIEDLQKQVDEAKGANQLQACIGNIEQNLFEVESMFKIGLHQEDKQRELFQTLIQNLREEETKKPKLELRFTDKNILKNEVQTILQKFFETLFSVKDGLAPHLSITTFQSKLANLQDLQTIKNWLPEEYSQFHPKLLYRASEHGPETEKFHQHCDGKGPTITLVHCLFDGAKEPTIIGGFLDKSWSSNQGNIDSEKAFLFSLSSKIKSPLISPGVAAFGRKTYGPAFSGASSYELVVFKNSDTCYLSEKYYQGSARLANIEHHDGKGRLHFKLLDYEVFTLVSS